MWCFKNGAGANPMNEELAKKVLELEARLVETRDSL